MTSLAKRESREDDGSWELEGLYGMGMDVTGIGSLGGMWRGGVAWGWRGPGRPGDSHEFNAIYPSFHS